MYIHDRVGGIIFNASLFIQQNGRDMQSSVIFKLSSMIDWNLYLKKKVKTIVFFNVNIIHNKITLEVIGHQLDFGYARKWLI